MLTFRIASAKTQKKTQLLSQPFIPNKLKARDTTTKRQEEPVQENDTNQKMNKKVQNSIRKSGFWDREREDIGSSWAIKRETQ